MPERARTAAKSFRITQAPYERDLQLLETSPYEKNVGGWCHDATDIVSVTSWSHLELALLYRSSVCFDDT